MRAWSKTKIIATLGPASQDAATIGKLLAAGADCFRINFSHGDGKSLRPLYESARAAAAEAGLPIPLLADIQGPKLRIGDLPSEGVMLHSGAEFSLTTRDVSGSAAEVHTPHEELVADVRPGAVIYLADGTIRLRVESVTDTDVKTSVLTGGALFSHKGINVPGVSLSSIPTLTEKDERDLRSVADMG
ncbi:MAG: pyruvate kinase, partial [Chrysiogenetes bacterium]|nr:pyruvate kinase [Chrysiogenetes bacterium]